MDTTDAEDSSDESLDVVSRMGSDDERSGITFALYDEYIEPPDAWDFYRVTSSWHAAWYTQAELQPHCIRYLKSRLLSALKVARVLT